MSSWERAGTGIVVQAVQLAEDESNIDELRAFVAPNEIRLEEVPEGQAVFLVLEVGAVRVFPGFVVAKDGESFAVYYPDFFLRNFVPVLAPEQQ